MGSALEVRLQRSGNGSQKTEANMPPRSKAPSAQTACENKILFVRFITF